jgi:hypothetical protein
VGVLAAVWEVVPAAVRVDVLAAPAGTVPAGIAMIGTSM